MVDLCIDTHHKLEARLTACNVLGCVAERITTAKLLKAHQMRMPGAQLKKQIGLSFIPVVGAVVNDTRQVDRRSQNTLKVGALRRHRASSREHPRDNHEPLSAHFLGMCSERGSPCGALCAGAHHDWHASADQVLDPLHARFVREQRPVAHGAAVHHGGHARSNELLTSRHQSREVGTSIRLAGRHQCWNRA